MQQSSAIIKQTKTILSFAKKNILLFAFLLLHEIGFGQKSSVLDKKTKPLYGIASFYSKSLEGTPTATGETFHHTEMSAASNSFKLNSWVRVTNLQNGKSILVRINDRMSKGMQAIGRVADLTRTAAKELGFLSRGLTKVKVEPVSAY
ncbi:MAG: septal ring lytic transglycosylase RlpA family protein [Bacteroidota bacterium]|nr:septal ring lytic transglycosylase RlpA family protein [Bacteroidota bacterium]